MTASPPIEPAALKLSVAPMMDWTDSLCRRIHRRLSRHTLLYTEMVTAPALVYGDRAKLLDFDVAEHPVALQLGGSDPAQLAEAARIGAEWGYDEINLNVGCPSDRVQNGRFGACLMAEPDLVARCLQEMQAATRLPVTVKHRIGIDEQESYEALKDFVATVAEAGCRSFIVHARKAWLKGLSPKENREIPPLRHAMVHRLKQDFPQLEIIINGGLTSLEAAAVHLEKVDGVMLGRAAYQDPWILAEVDSRLFGQADPVQSREEAVEKLLPWVREAHGQGLPVKVVTRHILGLFNGLPGARAWRRHLSEKAVLPGAGPEILEEALALVQAAEARRAA